MSTPESGLKALPANILFFSTNTCTVSFHRPFFYCFKYSNNGTGTISSSQTDRDKEKVGGAPTRRSVDIREDAVRDDLLVLLPVGAVLKTTTTTQQEM